MCVTVNRNTEGDRSFNLSQCVQKSIPELLNWCQSFAQRLMCVFLYSRMPAELCVRGDFELAMSRPDINLELTAEIRLWCDTPLFNWPAGLTRASSALTHENNRTHTKARLHSQTDDGADRHSMREKHLQGPDSVILALKRSTDDDVVALCHYDEKHDVSDASSFI